MKENIEYLKFEMAAGLGVPVEFVCGTPTKTGATDVCLSLDVPHVESTDAYKQWVKFAQGKLTSKFNQVASSSFFKQAKKMKGTAKRELMRAAFILKSKAPTIYSGWQWGKK